MSRKYESIRRIIIERQAASRRLNEAIHRVNGLERHTLRLEKRGFGEATRIKLFIHYFDPFVVTSLNLCTCGAALLLRHCCS